MKRLHISGNVDCRVFRDWLYHLQSGELAAEDVDKLLAHAGECGECDAYREVEASLLIGLQARLRPEPAPEGLEQRVREALAEEARPGRNPVPWYRGSAVSALAAVALLAVLLVPALGGLGQLPDGGFGSTIRLTDVAVTVVDGDCDRDGKTAAQQAACRHQRHINVLKRNDGTYWHINLDSPDARDLVLDPDQRGRRLVVAADYYPRLGTVHLIQVNDPAPTPI